ncbi:MAG: adenosine deaminase family protein [Planctomycetia bacterium]|nr:adenosine deaminase family protein [Planctomycetia bacterium]
MSGPRGECVIETIRAMPKAEMHFHFEGSFRWSTVRELHPGGREFPDRPPWWGRRLSWEDFTGVFRDYLKPATGTPEAVERHAAEALEDLVRLNVRYVELLVSHRFHAWRGMSERQVWEAVVRGREKVKGIDARLLLGISRDQAPGEAEAVLEQIAAFAILEGWLEGIDLQSDERARPNRDFVRLYRRAAELGRTLRSHAGELGGPDNVRDAVRECGALHISHGTRAAEDPALVAERARRGAWLHLCPTSNVRLGVCASYEALPLKAFLDAGVRLTVNADDPLLFDTDTTREYLVAHEQGLPVAELARNGFRASLWSAARIEAACADIDRAFASLPAAARETAGGA